MAVAPESAAPPERGTTPQLEPVRAYWEAYAERVLARGSGLQRQEHFARLRDDHETAYARADALLHRHEVAGKDLLELGCGMGFDTIPLAQAGARVVAIDISAECLRHTRRHLSWYGADAELRLGDAEHLEFPAASFDFVIARGLLMFTPDPVAVLREALRVLRPGGWVQAILHNRYSWYVALGRLSRMNLVDPVEDPSPNRLYTRREVRALFGEFDDVRIDGGRLPTIPSKRGGVGSKVFNGLVVPLARITPRRILEPCGFYLIAEGRKPSGPNE